MKKFLLALAILILPCLVMASSYNTVSVTGSATLVVPNSRSRAGWIITNTDSDTIYVGFDSSVTTANGIPIASNQSLMNDGNYRWNGNIYAIVGSGTADVRYMEWGLSEIQ